MWLRFWKPLKICKSTYNLGPSPPAILFSIKTFDFFTLCTTIPNSKPKDRLRELVQLIKKNGQRRYKYLVLGRDRSYFEKKKKTLWSYQNVLWDWFINMLVFLIDLIFAMFGGRVFQQTVGIPMDTNSAPLLADLFLYLYEADFFFFFWNKVHVSLIITDISNFTVEDLLRTMLNYKEVSIFKLWNFQQHMHMENIYSSWYDIQEIVVPIGIALIDGCC